MNLYQLKHLVKSPRKRPKRVGRGDSSGHGGTSTRGHKGQKARSGYHRRAYFEGGQMPLIRRLPKRGFSNVRFRAKIKIINIEQLNKFEDGSIVTPEKMRQNRLLKGSYDEIKILGKGELKKRLTVQAHHFSQSALEKIKNAQGTCVVLSQAK